MARRGFGVSSGASTAACAAAMAFFRRRSRRDSISPSDASSICFQSVVSTGAGRGRARFVGAGFFAGAAGTGAGFCAGVPIL